MISTNFKRYAAEHVLRYHKAASCHNEALPLGNGRIGAMVYGGACEEKISLNEDTLWSGYSKHVNERDYRSVYKEAKRLLEMGQITQAQKLLESDFGDYLVQMYLPVADLSIHTGHEGVSKYRRVLELDRALHITSYEVDGKKFQRETLVSEPYQVMTVRFTCDVKRAINLQAKLTGRLLKCECSNNGNHLLLRGTAPSAVAEYGKAYRSEEALVYDGKGVSYACVLGVKTEGGRVAFKQNCVQVEEADEVIIYLGIHTNFCGFKKQPTGTAYLNNCIAEVEAAKKVPYEVLKKESIASHQRLYCGSGISLMEDASMARIFGRIPTNERLTRLGRGIEDNALYALLFNFGKYLTISGSRKGTQAMNLQGIWNDKILPPWNCNYTLNINTEMNYWPTLSLGLGECFEPFVRMVEELAESGKETARIYYGVDGWVCHHSTDIWRLTHPGTNRLCNNAQWGFWNMASGWLSVMLWNYYTYTLDVDYLERIYPVIEGAAKFYSNLLTEKDGELILSPSTSPENNYLDENDGEKHAIDHSTAMTQEILYDLFEAVSKASKVLEIPDIYGELLPKLKRPFIQGNGELCEWHQEHDVWDYHHRHVSHLYGLFPSNQFKGNQEMLEACRKVLESRGDDGTGWSLAWKINLWARLGDGEHALRLLNNQLRMVPAECDSTSHTGGSYPNLFCAHPPFQIDGNFGAMNGIIEMLIQCDEKCNPILLPALPKTWKSGSVYNLCLPGNRRVSFTWKQGKITWQNVMYQ